MSKSNPVFAYAQLNEKVMPDFRGDQYEIPLGDALEEAGLGEVAGGGTLQQQSGEIEYCGIDVDLFDLERGVRFVCEFLENAGAARGSKLTYEQNGQKLEKPFGKVEGLGIYLNGTDLPAEVYQSSDINVVIERLNKLLESEGAMRGYWQGPTETALYFYGNSATKMRELIAPFMAAYPLCQRARIVDIA
jgi:hypothetical protein